MTGLYWAAYYPAGILALLVASFWAGLAGQLGASIMRWVLARAFGGN
jgi:hypothetical protein